MKRTWLWTALGALAVVAGVSGVFFLRGGTVAEILDLVTEGGEVRLREPMRPIRGETRVLLLALDGVGDGRLRALVESGRMPHLAALLGRRQDDDV